MDGKQRLETILLFANDKIRIPSDFPDARFAGKKWKEISETDRSIFWNDVLPVEQLDFSNDDTAAVNDAFDRLNRNSRRLEPQELRHARFDGWFAATVEEQCQDEVWKEIGLITKARAKRMKDAQFLSELLAVLIEKQQFGFDQDHLDQLYAKYDHPDEEGVEIDTDNFATSLAAMKAFLVQLNNVNQCVKTAAATVGAFYTLWSLLVLHSDVLPPADALAHNYQEFVQMAARLRDEVSPTGVQLTLGAGQTNWPDYAFNYAKALQGAQTDLTPRQTRLENLLAAMRV